MTKLSLPLRIVVLFLFVSLASSAQDWYDLAWQFRNPIAIANPGGTTLTGYQVMITLDNGSFDFSKANSDGSDLRAASADGTILIPFWIEEWDAAAELARVWIKIPSIPLAGTTAFIYYGNPDATATGNGTLTFSLFDDDNWASTGGSVDWAKTGSPAVSSGVISFAAGQAIQSPATFAVGCAIGFRANYGPPAGNENRWGGFINGTGGTSPPDRAVIQKQVAPYAPSNDVAYLSTHPTYTELSTLDDQFHVYEVLWRTGQADAILDHGAASIITTSNVPSISLPLTFYNYAGTSPLQLDWVFLRQYSSPEPSGSVGAEQTTCPDPPIVSSPITYCQGGTAIPLSAEGENLLWYTTPTGGTGSSIPPTPSTATAGTTSHYVSQTVYGCESERAQIDVIINENPGTPTAEIIEPTCAVPTGTITVTSPLSGLSFSIDGIDYSNTTGVFVNVNPGSYSLTAQNSSGCFSGENPVVITAYAGSPDAPTADVTQPSCTVATGTITVTSSTTGLSFSLNGLDYTNTTGIFAGVSQGTYFLTAKNAGDCISVGTEITVEPAPEVPAPPTADVTQPACVLPTGTITVTSSTTGLSFSIDGNDYTNTSGVFTGVDPGNYDLTAKNSSGCISPVTQLTVNNIPPPPTGTIEVVNPDLCYGDLYYQLKLTSATGESPYTLVVDGISSATVAVGEIFATINVRESIWNNTVDGIGAPAGGSTPYELGLKFKPAVNGYVLGVRFHKASTNTGTHVGSLWSIAGTKLASATFTNETSEGWQEVLFDTPVAVTANTIYVVSYTDPAGQFSFNPGYFTSGFTSGNLYALSNTDPASAGNGVYNTVPGSFPASSAGSNYWVDVVFSLTDGSTPHTYTSELTTITSNDGCTNTGSPLSSASVTLNVTPAGTISPAGTYCENSDMSLIFNATAGIGPFDLEVNGINYSGISNGIPFSVGTTGSNQAHSIWPASAAGSDPATPSSDSYELGVKFRSSVPGQITSIRFFKRAAQEGPFAGTLWSNTGTVLATATFTTTSSGWQQVDFTTPISIEPNVTYVASYYAPLGNYPVDLEYFTSTSVTNGALTALQAGVDGLNGVYAASTAAATAFPAATYQNANYWVDVVFVPASNNIFELTSISSLNGCEVIDNPINLIAVPVYLISTAPTAISGISTVDYGNSTTLSVEGGSLGTNAIWTWYSGSCGGTAEGTGTSITVSPLENTEYFVRAEGDCNMTDCAQLTVTVIHPSTVWSGTVNTDWSEGGNWNNGVPLSYTNVSIPAAPSNQPHVLAPPDSPDLCRNLTIDAGAAITIDPTGALSVTGVLLNDGIFTIQSTDLGTGSLIDNGTIGGTGVFRVEQYLTSEGWHYVSSPIADGLSEVYFDIYLREFNEPTGLWDEIIAIDHELTPMKGFAAWADDSYTGTTVVSYEGSLNTGEQSINNLTNSGEAIHNHKGFNLVGNPYPSPLDWASSAWTKVNIDNGIYFWDHDKVQYAAATYMDNYVYATNGANSVIPSGQGFFVHVTEGFASGSLSVTNSARLHDPQPFYKQNGSGNDLRSMKLQSRSGLNTFTDETIIIFDPAASNSYDPEYDAFKFLGGAQAPQLYTKSDDPVKLSINTLPEFTESIVIPLYLQVGPGGKYTLEVTELNNFEDGTEIILEDKQDDVFCDVKQQKAYSFFAGPLDDPGRFMLHFTSTPYAIIEPTDQKEINIYSHDNAIYVLIPEESQGDIFIYNLLGELLVSRSSVSGLAKIPIYIDNAFLLVKVITTKGLKSRKVFPR